LKGQPQSLCQRLAVGLSFDLTPISAVGGATAAGRWPALVRARKGKRAHLVRGSYADVPLADGDGDEMFASHRSDNGMDRLLSQLSWPFTASGDEQEKQP
jgi:hypothetical protein